MTSHEDDDDSTISNPRRNLEEEYLDYEAKVFGFCLLFLMIPFLRMSCTMNIATPESMHSGENILLEISLFPDSNNLQCGGQHERAHVLSTGKSFQVGFSFPVQISNCCGGAWSLSSISVALVAKLDPCPSRRDDSKVRELFDDIEKLRKEFELIERPTLEMESPDRQREPPTSEKPQEAFASSSTREAESPKAKKEHLEPSEERTEQVLDHEAELAKLESEFGNVGEEYTSEEIGGWEFDELEKELAATEPSKGK